MTLTGPNAFYVSQSQTKHSSVLPKATHGRGCRLFVPGWNTAEIWITWVFPHSLRLSQLDEGAGILETLTSREASWHKSCKRLYYPNRLILHQKRIESDETPDDSTTVSSPPKRVCMRTVSLSVAHNYCAVYVISLCYIHHSTGPMAVIGQQCWRAVLK